MSKQIFHINRFEGGFNTDFAPEDIPDNSLLDALGISVSNIGRIIMPGDPHADSGIDTENAHDSVGYGLFAFNSDYTLNSNVLNAVSATKYLVMQNGSYTKIWDGSSWDAHEDIPFDLGASNASFQTKTSYYAPNGDLRICDGNFESPQGLIGGNQLNNVKWWGFSPHKTIGTGVATIISTSIGGWNVQDASIEGGHPKDGDGKATTAVISDINSIRTGGSNNYLPFFSTSGNNPHSWGAHIGYVPSNVSASTFAGSTWQPNTTDEYKFYSSFVYDGEQEGNPTIMGMYPSVADYSDAENSLTKQSALRFMDNSHGGHIGYCKLVRASTTVTVTCFSDEARTSALANNLSVGDTVLIEGGNTLLNGYYEISEDTSATSFKYETTASGTISIHEGYYSKVGTNLAVHFIPQLKFNSLVSSTAYNFGGATAIATTGGNKRIIGSRLYYSSSDEGHGNLWIIFDYSFEKGVKAFGVGRDEPTVTDYLPWGGGASSSISENFLQGIVGDDAENMIWRHPPKYDTYESLNGYSHNSKLDAKWKTAVIANGRAYIGNVKRRQKSTFDINTALANGKQDWSNIIVNDPTFGDRILKSPVDKFDTFPEEMAIDLFGGDDGDSIIKLETFADRLFVFKRNILHILNIAKDTEILESSHKGMGLDGRAPFQSCLTRNGIAWMNSSGVYHYNGENIESLTDNKIESFWRGGVTNISASAVSAFWLSDQLSAIGVDYGDAPSIGYDIESNKLIIHKTSTASGSGYEDILIYDMKVKAWTRLNEALDNATRTNMINYDGMLIYHENDASGDPMLRYNDTPHPPGGTQETGAGEGLKVYTKPFDFGTPLQRKKIYKVYVTYRCVGTTGNDNVQIQYYVNGNINLLYNFTTGASNDFNADDDNIALDGGVAEFDTTGGRWETASLKPATSSQANNIKSFGLYIFNASGAVDKDFELNDITIVYRAKSAK